MMRRKNFIVKRLILAVVLFVFVANMASAQVLLAILFGDKLSTEKFQLGMNLGISFSDVMGLDDTNWRTSWAFGVFGEIKLGRKWTLQPELTIKTPGGAKDIPWEKPEDPCLDELFSDVSVTRQTSYLTLPIYLKYQIGALRIGLGPQFGYLTGAKDKYIGKAIGEHDFTLEKDLKDALNSWDAGLTVLVEYALQPKKGMRSMRITFKYYYGLLDTVKDNPGDAVTNSLILIGVGIPVGGGSEDKEK